MRAESILDIDFTIFFSSHKSEIALKICTYLFIYLNNHACGLSTIIIYYLIAEFGWKLMKKKSNKRIVVEIWHNKTRIWRKKGRNEWKKNLNLNLCYLQHQQQQQKFNILFIFTLLYCGNKKKQLSFIKTKKNKWTTNTGWLLLLLL